MPSYMQDRFGAWQEGIDPTKGKVEFKIFFPSTTADPSQYVTTNTNYTEKDNQGNDVTKIYVKPPKYGDPEIVSIQVIGDFQAALSQINWDTTTAPLMTKSVHPQGTVWFYTTPVELPAGFYEYQYFVTFVGGEKRIVSDPCARYGGCRNLDKVDPNPRENLNSGIVVGGSRSTVKPLPSGRKHLRDLVVYELNLDDFTDEFRGARAPLDAAVDKLDYIQDLGFNAILVMPWTAWPGGGFNWGYEPFLYFAVAYRYANNNDPEKPAEKLSYLKRFINECHQRDIHVIMDGVFNHVTGNKKFPYYLFYQTLSQDNPTQPNSASPYTGAFDAKFSGLTDLDFNNGCVEEYVRDVCFYWMDEFGIDGIRFDNTPNFFISGNPRGLPNLISAVNGHAGDPNFSTTLEHLDLDASQATNQVNATSYWNNALFGVAFDYLYNYRIPQRIMEALDSKKGLLADRVATTYLTNHDHSHLAWQAGASSNDGSRLWFRTQPLAIALMTFPGSPMIQNGQEFAEDYWLVEDDKGAGRRVQPRPLHWSFANDQFGTPLRSLYKKLIEIRKTHPGLRSDNVYPVDWPKNQTQFNSEGYGINQDSGIVIYHRYGNDATGTVQRFIIVLNFSQNKKNVSVPFPDNGVWDDILNGWQPSVSGNRLNFEIDSNWGHIFFK
jgi:1,4-alpha-glucan branching enzyme